MLDNSGFRNSRIQSQPLQPKLALELIPRQNWQDDGDVKKCLQCDRSFIAFYRRKHHCRKCGQVFCSDCSNNFLDGQLFAYDEEKKLRFCSKCHTQLESMRRGLEEQLSKSQTDPEPPPPAPQIENEFNPEVEVEDIQKFLMPEERTNDLQILKEKASEQMERICDYIMRHMQVKQEYIDFWKPIMANFIKQAVDDIKMQAINNDFMDINCYVKKKIIPFQDHSMTKYLKGLVYRKNVALKKMSIQLIRPKILIITESLDLIVKSQFEDYVQKEKKMIHDIVDKIMTFHPNLILIEKQANKHALDLLHKNGVTVVLNIKQSSLRRIAQSTGSKFAKLEKLDDYIKTKRKVLGECKLVYFRNFPKQDTSPKDSTLMFIETENGNKGVTMTLSGPNYETLKQLKRCITGVLRIAKHFDVERSMIMTEQKLKKQNQFPQIGDFTKFLFEKVQRQEFMKPDLTYIKINFVKADLSNFNDIKDEATLNAYKDEYAIKNTGIVEFNLAQMCNIPVEKKQASFHSQDDTCLGAFIILKVLNMDKKCEWCKLPRADHISVYYSNGKFVRISTEGKLKDFAEVPMLRKQTSTYSSYSNEENKSIFSMKDLPEILQRMNKQIKIETYVEYNNNGQLRRESELIPLTQQNMEYSYLRFLQHLLLTPQGQNPLKQYTRVFQYEDCKIKCMVGDFEVYQTTILNFNDSSIQEHLVKWEQQKIKTNKDKLIQNVESLTNTLINQVNKAIQNKAQGEVIIQALKQLKEEFLKKLSEAKFTDLFQIDQIQNEYGLKFHQFYQTIMDQKKKNEVMVSNLVEQANTLLQKQQHPPKTAMDLDHNDKLDESINDNYLRPQSLEVNKYFDGLSDLVIENKSPNLQTQGNFSNSFRDLDQHSLQAPQTPAQNSQNSDMSFLSLWGCHLGGFLNEQSRVNKEMQKYPYVPIYEGQTLSYVAFALNHPKYQQDIYRTLDFTQFEDKPKTTEAAKQFYTNILIPKIIVKEERQSEVIDRGRLITQVEKMDDKYAFVLRINYDLSQKSPLLKAQTTPQLDEYRKLRHAEVILYFPAQYEALRQINGISLKQFIKSISHTLTWNAQGGKSSSKFFKSSDELFIFKKLEDNKEFLMFKKFAMNYFEHMQRHIFDNKPSLLSKIYGMFEVKDKTTEYYIVMENLLFGMGDDLKIYDLKGSETNRWETKKKGVLLDTNFKVDRNSQPIPIFKEHHPYIDRAFQIVCKFLHKYNIIDYSLLLVIDNKQLKLRMGIIDYLRFYTWDKETEHYLKYILKGGMVPTIVNPQDYKKRFIDVILVQTLRDIQNEEEEVLEQFNKMAKEAKTLQSMYDVMEMINYEMNVRGQDKLNLLDQITNSENELLQQIMTLQCQVQQIQQEFENVNNFQQTRSLRQTGRYLQFKHSKQHYESNKIDSPNTITCVEYDENQYQQDLAMINVFDDVVKYNTQREIDETQVYDWILDIELITNVAINGWPVYLSQYFKDQSIITDQYKKWDGATVAVVGLYDKGKTFVLNNLTQSNLPSGKKVTTKGISFKHVDVDSGTQLILVDTAGSYSPVKIQTSLSIVEKEATEHFIIDLVFELSDYFICVVNDFTSLDQRYLDRLSRNIQNSSKTFREIIVVHNLKEVESSEILQHVWTTQVTQIYQTGGSIQRTKVAAHNPITNQLQEKHVLWFKTQYTRHVCLVSDDSNLGLSVNPWVFSLLKYWLKAVFVPVNRQFSVCESILQYAKSKLSQYFKRDINLKMVDTDNQLVKRIVQVEADCEDQGLRIPQTSIDQSGLILARPDSFAPATDIIANEQYIIYMDVPGISEDEIEMYRQNIVTIVKGNRKKPYVEESDHVKKQERKYGEFTLSFKIPENFERKWSHFGIENGVLKIVYDKDKDDIVPSKSLIS